MRALPVIFILLLTGPAAVWSQSTSPAAEEEDMAAYLLVYFKDDAHSLHMALSPDGAITLGSY